MCVFQDKYTRIPNTLTCREAYRVRSLETGLPDAAMSPKVIFLI